MYFNYNIIWRFFIVTFLALFFLGCSKEKEDILKTEYAAQADPSELYSEFTVQLKGNALQKNEKGSWQIAKGKLMEKFVEIKDPDNPNTLFLGLPGEEYTLSWTVTHSNKSTSSSSVVVKIPELEIKIEEYTPDHFQTIRFFAVDEKYKDIGKWSIDKPVGHLHSMYHDGYFRPNVEDNPTIEVHGFANTEYEIKYLINYGGKSYRFSKVIKTGNYQEDEALHELQMGRGTSRVVEDKNRHVIELNLQASGITYRFNEVESFPALKAFTYLRKLILGGSSLRDVPTVFGDHYLALEELSLDRVGKDLNIPENFGNLTKLKSLHLTPLYSATENRTLKMPKSFGNLSSLEYLRIEYAGNIDFNGTLGKLTNLKTLACTVTDIPNDFGNLKKLESLDIRAQKAYLPASFSTCANLRFARLSFWNSGSSTASLPSDIDNLTKLDTLEITGEHRMQTLPQSFGNLKNLRHLWIEGQSLQSIPDNIGNLSNLEFWLVAGQFKTLPPSIGNLKNLKYLWLSSSVQNLPNEFGHLTSLSYLNLESSKLTTFPETFGQLKNLKEINARASTITHFPKSFGNLDGLEKLDFNYSKLEKFPESICDLKKINIINLNGTRIGKLPEAIYRLKDDVQIMLYQAIDVDFVQLKEITSKRGGLLFYTDQGYIH